MLRNKCVLMKRVLSAQKGELLLFLELYFDCDAGIGSLCTYNWFHFTSLRLYISSGLVYRHVFPKFKSCAVF